MSCPVHSETVVHTQFFPVISKRYMVKSGIMGAGIPSSNLKHTSIYLLTQASIISLAISLSLCSKWWANSCSGQCRSQTNICSASSFQNRSSDVVEPLLEEKGKNKEHHELPMLTTTRTTHPLVSLSVLLPSVKSIPHPISHDPAFFGQLSKSSFQLLNEVR